MVYNERMGNGTTTGVFPTEADITTEYLNRVELDVRGRMDDRRFTHTLGVMREAAALARRYGLSEKRAALTGLLHDCAKRMPYEEMLALAKEHALVSDPEMLSSPNALHGFVGAYVAKRDFLITDEETLSAIAYHTFGHPGMTDFEKCIFIADATESLTRRYEGAKEARELSYRSLNAAVMLLLKQTRAYVLAQGFPYFTASGITMDWLENLLTSEDRLLLNHSTRGRS